MTNSLDIRLVKTRKELEEVLRLRKTVFVEEQDVPKEIEFDGLDQRLEHVIVRLDGKTIGCARIRPMNGKVKLERIAILKEQRNKGFGKMLMQYLISHCRQIGANEIVIHAQHHLRGFYEDFGFKSKGQPFMEAGIKHIEMLRVP